MSPLITARRIMKVGLRCPVGFPADGCQNPRNHRDFRNDCDPELLRVFRFRATRMERYLVACYDSTVGGYFRPHRDNDGEGHRQFAVTINLNAEEYEGGDLRFPEYGLQTYRAPTGGACVFSCGLMHEATPVTRGKRYAFLPFLDDEAAAARREANNEKYVDPSHHYQYQPAEPRDVGDDREGTN